MKRFLWFQVSKGGGGGQKLILSGYWGMPVCIGAPNDQELNSSSWTSEICPEVFRGASGARVMTDEHCAFAECMEGWIKRNSNLPGVKYFLMDRQVLASIV